MFTRRLLIGSVGLVGSALGFSLLQKQRSPELSANYDEGVPKLVSRGPSRFPTRVEMLKSLKEDKEWDILVIGGGATGCGVALDAALRGLDVALVEKNDFSSGTSSRSTKLIHGGVRYLEKAFKNLDYGQYALVREALRERANLLTIAPHMAYELPIMLPIYKYWQVPYFWIGCKAYDFFAGKQSLESSYFLPKSRALEKFPWLKKEKLAGAMVYYDGAHNDARMNISLALTGLMYGATMSNHVEVTSLIRVKDEDGKEKVKGAMLKDTLTGEEWKVRAKGVISAVGPFTDQIRRMEDEKVDDIVSPSQGVHIILPGYYSPANMGMLDPATSDGRVIFFLPWQGSTIAGTTDSLTKVTHHPKPKEEEIQFILKEIKSYLSSDIQVRRGDVLAAWSGIRPLVRDPSKPSTEGLSRNHVVHVTDNDMVVVAGGKWTTYRQMAEDTVDAAIKTFNLEPRSKCSRTLDAVLVGGHHFKPTMFIDLVQKFGLETDVAKHLCESYGDRAADVAKVASMTGKNWPVTGSRLNQAYPYLEAEVRYAVRNEMACTAEDVIARRLRLAFLNADVTMDVLPKVIEIMAKELKWSKAEQSKQMEAARKFLITMGLTNSECRSAFNANELVRFRKVFDDMDENGDGTISYSELRWCLDQLGVEVAERDFEEFVHAVDVDNSGGIEWNEFLDMVHEVRVGTESSKFEVGEKLFNKFNTERSGGGV